MTKKELDKKEPELETYKVKIDALIPAELLYSIQAESPEEAARQALRLPIKNKKIFFEKIKKQKLKVYHPDSSLIVLTKNVG